MLKIKKNGRENSQEQILIEYDRTGDSATHVFARNEEGYLEPLSTNQTYPAKIVEEDGQEQNIKQNQRAEGGRTPGEDAEERRLRRH